jgi:RIO kinase 1
LKQKIRLEDIKELKIERKVFDDKTLFAIYKLMKKGIVKTVESIAKEGKESVVLSAKNPEGEWIALKLYRIEYSNFKRMWEYLAEDPRFFGLKKSRRAAVYTWCKREFKNLKIAHDAGVNCPKPIKFIENILVTEFIGKDGELAPMLIDLKFDQRDAQLIYQDVLNEIEKIVKAGLVHTDFSAYNILFFDRVCIIDFSQAVTFEHPNAKEFLKRDIKNINSYFKKLDVKLEDEEKLYDRLIKVAGLK